MVQAFTQGPAKLEVKKGGKFELFGGNIHGEFLEVVSSILFSIANISFQTICHVNLSPFSGS